MSDTELRMYACEADVYANGTKLAGFQLFISGRGEEVQQTVRVLQEGKRLTTVALLFIRTRDCLKPITLLRGCVAAGLEP